MWWNGYYILGMTYESKGGGNAITVSKTKTYTIFTVLYNNDETKFVVENFFNILHGQNFETTPHRSHIKSDFDPIYMILRTGPQRDPTSHPERWDRLLLHLKKVGTPFGPLAGRYRKTFNKRLGTTQNDICTRRTTSRSINSLRDTFKDLEKEKDVGIRDHETGCLRPLRLEDLGTRDREVQQFPRYQFLHWNPSFNPINTPNGVNKY